MSRIKQFFSAANMIPDDCGCQMHGLLNKFTFHVNQYFPDWQKSGKTYLVPPSPLTKFIGPVEKDSSGYDQKLNSKMESVIRGDRAESLIHQFWSQSQRHAFVLQGFKIRSWFSAIESHADFQSPESSFSKLEKLAEAEVDFLVLDAYQGVILMECKAVPTYRNNRYLDAKDQLLKSYAFTEKLTEMLAKTEVSGSNKVTKWPKIPIRKVISFPFAKMKDINNDKEDYVNLGCNHLEENYDIWFNRLSTNSIHNWFENPLFQKLVSILIGMYSSVTLLSEGVNIMDVYRQIDTQRFLHTSKCSTAKSHRVTSRDTALVDQFIFLNPEQHQVWRSIEKKQILGGCQGVGKTLLVMHKAKEKILQNRSVVIFVPRFLTPKYEKFCRRFDSEAQKFQIFPFDQVLQTDLDKLIGKDVFVDEFHVLFEILGSVPTAKIAATHRTNKRIRQKLVEFFCRDSEENQTIMISFLSNHVRRSSFPLRRVELFSALNHVLESLMNAGFEKHILSTVVRGTRRIVDTWKSKFDEMKRDEDESPTNSLQISIGHNILGEIVDKELFDNVESLLNKLLYYLEKLKYESNQAEESKWKVWPCNVSVLCAKYYLKNQISCFLEANCIQTGSIKEQCESQQELLALDMTENSLSYEWAVVFYVYDATGTSYFALTPLSRAVSKLYVFGVCG